MRRAYHGTEHSGGVWALILGSITALIQFLLGDIGSPGGFGFSRWLFALVNLIGMPVLVPLFLYLILCIFKEFTGHADFTNFALLWLIPVGALRAIHWSSFNDPILLVAVPLLWTAIAVGIPFFIYLMTEKYSFSASSFAISILCILLLPALAATSYWAFFCHYTVLGFICLIIANIPLVLSFHDGFIS
jgi:hypothetical protein